VATGLHWSKALPFTQLHIFEAAKLVSQITGKSVTIQSSLWYSPLFQACGNYKRL